MTTHAQINNHAYMPRYVFKDKSENRKRFVLRHVWMNNYKVVKI